MRKRDARERSGLPEPARQVCGGAEALTGAVAVASAHSCLGERGDQLETASLVLAGIERERLEGAVVLRSRFLVGEQLSRAVAGTRCVVNRLLDVASASGSSTGSSGREAPRGREATRAR
jgi:hypothetical protein